MEEQKHRDTHSHAPHFSSYFIPSRDLRVCQGRLLFFFQKKQTRVTKNFPNFSLPDKKEIPETTSYTFGDNEKNRRTLPDTREQWRKIKCNKQGRPTQLGRDYLSRSVNQGRHFRRPNTSWTHPWAVLHVSNWFSMFVRRFCFRRLTVTLIEKIKKILQCCGRFVWNFYLYEQWKKLWNRKYNHYFVIKNPDRITGLLIKLWWIKQNARCDRKFTLWPWKKRKYRQISVENNSLPRVSPTIVYLRVSVYHPLGTK